ncbi:DUF4038 domain-containing protein [Candidatus Poribacteria bacterium]|jgi:hypothetical protein|nr:DUF4038 domain-containing protein [Candidatus Poribacteria bacterium]MBT5536430.1 DUF4038 domain-containing protein [Candidatus Poribacteria bacterium]MBT5710562.1 DUF4038 domain-containing protein [Candidatus Poribacteria bacterium]MBT7098845.1 DUF4038 domain-containing protein [Candidatus Poribacteria bacterium]MBT7805337.1 DUF4038 domain-containing protein [Candidatus Poribacteria bacterium]
MPNRGIRVSANGRYFESADGEPFFWLGDTQWQLARDFTLDEVDAIVRGRQRQGFNVLLVMLTGVGDGTRANVNGDAPWLADDPMTPNEAYFQHVDDALRVAQDAGMVVVLGVFHQLHVTRITTDNARRYARWVAERYGDNSNIVWSMYPRAADQFVPVTRELVAGLMSVSDERLISVHPDPSPASSSFMPEAEWLACHMIQSWAYLDVLVEMVAADYALHPPRPVVMAEGAYEDPLTDEYRMAITPLMVRQQAYASCLAGGFHVYGHTDMWKRPANWEAALDAPGATQMRVLRDVLCDLSWVDLVPDTGLLADGPSHALDCAARAADGSWALVYVAEGGTVDVRSESLGASSLRATRIDPSTGERSDLGAHAGSGAVELNAGEPGSDGLLLLRPLE